MKCLSLGLVQEVAGKGRERQTGYQLPVWGQSYSRLPSFPTAREKCSIPNLACSICGDLHLQASGPSISPRLKLFVIGLPRY